MPATPPARCRARLHLEWLEQRLTPALEPVVVPLPQVSGVLHIALTRQEVILSQDDGSVVQDVSWPARAPLEFLGSGADESFDVRVMPLPRAVHRAVLLDAAGGSNTAVLHGTRGLDQAAVRGADGHFQTGGFALQWQSVQHLELDGGAGGRDQIVWAATAGDVTFSVGPDQASMTDAQDNLSTAVGFTGVTASAAPGSQSSATLLVPPHWNRIVYAPQQTVLYAIHNTFDAIDPAGARYTLNGFANVTLDASAGTGQNILWAQAPAGDVMLRVNDGQGTFGSPGRFQLAFSGLQMLRFNVTGGAGASDQAFLTDGPGNDTFYARGATGTYLDDRNRYELWVTGFAVVNLDGSGGGLNLLARARTSYQLNATGFHPAAPYHTATPPNRAAALAQIRAVALTLDPALGQVSDPLSLAIALRDFIHHRFWLGPHQLSWLNLNPYERFVEAIVTRTETVMCHGAQVVYCDLANAFGLTVRPVDLASATRGHATVEVLLDGHWTAMDPTFDVSFLSPSGQYLNYTQLQAGASYTVEHNGTVSRARPNFENFAVPLSQLLEHVTDLPRQGPPNGG